MTMDNATKSQNRASDPEASTWLSANAGSGKTKVLTDRVARLLLRGVSPQNILCLTYTKAAASEMQNRLFKLLGGWAMMDEAKLGEELQKLGEKPGQDLNAARKLFARAIETPGGLKIQTIHSFCAALLRRFPLEAGLSPQFVEMDDRSSLILREEVVETLAMGKEQSTLARLARFYTGQDFDKLTKEICSKQSHFLHEVSKDQVWGWFGLAPGFDDESILGNAFAPGDQALLDELATILAECSLTTDLKVGNTLAAITLDPTDKAWLNSLISAFLTLSGTINKKFPTKKTREGPLAHLMDNLDDLRHRVEHANLQQNSLYSAQKTLALHNFARPFLAELEARKLQLGWVDFDDLIHKAGALLEEPSLAAWVLYRLDGDIDHILVDEAQDTSPEQWKVIRLLAQEFTSGDGARDTNRTIFVVGDPKQSIYSFQGADPAAFSDMYDHFNTGLKNVGKRLENRKLEYSFRSSPAILGLADLAFKDAPGLGAEFLHRAFFDNKPGRVDLWPVVQAETYKEERDWTDTSDITLPLNHNMRLGQSVAEEVERLLAEESIQDKDGVLRAVQPKDILILVRGRKSGLFDEIIRASKARQLPIAGADRLRIGGELAVKDLTALLRFLATPEDNLSLAATLKSPLFGLDEAALFDLAYDRPDGGYLWSVLRKQADTYPICVAALNDIRGDTDFLRPYDLLERILTRHKGRQNLVARLGHEAEDGIDALLSQALAYENTQTPSLTGFLNWLDAMEVEIKRQMDSASDQIRVMTIHGAKGLEAPIVILPDTAKKQTRAAPDLLETGTGNLVWKPPSQIMPPDIRADADLIAEAEEHENARLLYVAATRAESWLIVAAAGKVGSGSESWYGTIEQGLKDIGAEEFTSPIGAGLRYQTGDWAQPSAPNQKTLTQKIVTLPDWASQPVTTPKVCDGSISPSDMGGAKALAGETVGLNAEDAMKRGRQLHLLLEVLPSHPQEAWPKLAQILLSHGEDAASDQNAILLAVEASALLTNPKLDHIFAPDTLAEVGISAQLTQLDGQVINGSIDRLIISPEKVTIVDFKSNAIVPTKAADIPGGILRQMAAYAQAIHLIYPSHQIECKILWTTNADLMLIPANLIIEALTPP